MDLVCLVKTGKLFHKNRAKTLKYMSMTNQPILAVIKSWNIGTIGTTSALLGRYFIL